MDKNIEVGVSRCGLLRILWLQLIERLEKFADISWSISRNSRAEMPLRLMKSIVQSVKVCLGCFPFFSPLLSII